MLYKLWNLYREGDHLVAKFATNASRATWWPNLEPMQVAFFLLAGEITQVKESIHWVRCANIQRF